MKNLKARIGWFLIRKFEINPKGLLAIVCVWAFTNSDKE
jgi:hypothetical protein